MAVPVFLAWTLFVWVGRIRNVSADDTISAAERSSTIALALTFVIPAVLLLIAFVLARKTRSRAAVVVERFGVGAMAAFTTAVWLVRSVGIAGGDHDAAFIAVHLVLAIVSVVLAFFAVRTEWSN